MTNEQVLKIDENDNVVVAIRDINKGETIVVSSLKVQVQDEIPIYHKMAIEDISLGSPI